jgi:Holliday junction resolvase RusA-like endonuclease
MIRIIKEGKPMSQTRHRHTSRGGFVRTYDPMAKDKEDFVKYVSENYDIKKIEGMIDVDNIAKFYLDALNEILYDDDAQIVSLNVIKRYSILPFVIITFDEVMF